MKKLIACGVKLIAGGGALVLCCSALMFQLSRGSKRAGIVAAGINIEQLLDSRGFEKTLGTNEFNRFLREFCKQRTFEEKKAFVRSIGKENALETYIPQLLAVAQVCAQENVRSINMPWERSEALDCAGYTTLAITLLAAIQGVERPDLAVMDASCRDKVRAVWRSAYITALKATGAQNDNHGPEEDEAGDKLVAALKVSALLGDEPMRKVLVIVAGAWLAERLGQHERAESLRRQVGTNISWPPITHSGNRYRVVLPPEDVDPISGDVKL